MNEEDRMFEEQSNKGLIMSTIERKNKAVFGNFLGGLLTGGMQAPSKIGHGIKNTVINKGRRFEERRELIEDKQELPREI